MQKKFESGNYIRAYSIWSADMAICMTSTMGGMFLM